MPTPATGGYPVKLLVYDLSQGMARIISLGLVGRQIEGIWHTSVVVHGREWYFGQGVFSTSPGVHHYGRPVREVDMGVTDIGPELLATLIDELRPRFRAVDYHLLDHNCNTFSNELCELLVGRPIPDFVTNLPRDFLETPFGQSLRPVIDSFFSSPHAVTAGPSAAPTAPPTTTVPSSLAPPPSTASPVHPHLRLSLPTIHARLSISQVSTSSSPKLWIKLAEVLGRIWTNNATEGSTDSLATAISAQEFVAKVKAAVQAVSAAKESDWDKVPADADIVQEMRRLLSKEDTDTDRWVLLDTLRLLLPSPAYATAIREAHLAALTRDQSTLSPLPLAFHLAHLRALTNLVGAHPSHASWALDKLSPQRTQATSLLVAALLHEPRNLSLLKSAAALALAVAGHRVRRARGAQKLTQVWSADGSDEEWVVEMVGAISHVLTTTASAAKLGGSGEDVRLVLTSLFDALCGLIFTAPPGVVELVAAVGCVPGNLAGVVPDNLVRESWALFDV